MTEPVVVRKRQPRPKCLARWWNGLMVEACIEDAEKGHLRCHAHQPDGSRLGRDGKPTTDVRVG